MGVAQEEYIKGVRMCNEVILLQSHVRDCLNPTCLNSLPGNPSLSYSGCSGSCRTSFHMSTLGVSVTYMQQLDLLID